VVSRERKTTLQEWHCFILLLPINKSTTPGYSSFLSPSSSTGYFKLKLFSPINPASAKKGLQRCPRLILVNINNLFQLGLSELQEDQVKADGRRKICRQKVGQRSATQSSINIVEMTFSFLQIAILPFLFICRYGVIGAGRAEVMHYCNYQVWCAVVTRYEPNDPTPLNQRPPVKWIPQPAGQVIVDGYDSHPIDQGVAIMCTRDPTALKPLVTQLEYTWRPDEEKTYFDVSNVEGAPFLNEGFRVLVNDEIKPLVETCYGAYCAPGDRSCIQVYNKANDDFQGMRACSPEVVTKLILCSG